MCQVPLFQHKEAYLGEVLGCGEHSAHGDASLCGFAAKDLVHGHFESVHRGRQGLLAALEKSLIAPVWLCT